MNYKITKVLRALWLAERSVCMRVCKHSYDVTIFERTKLFYKSNRKPFPAFVTAWHKHSWGWENSEKLWKPLISSWVCTTVQNSANPSRVYNRLCKQGESFLLLKYRAGKACIRVASFPIIPLYSFPCINVFFYYSSSWGWPNRVHPR